MSVRTYDLRSDWYVSGLDEWHPSSLRIFSGEKIEWDNPGDTAYVFAHRGPVEIFDYDRGFTSLLLAGMFAQVPCAFELRGGAGILIERHGYRGVHMSGGPIEKTGRLRYIDGCTDSLLIAPARMGDPCLNHLHFPKDIDQTAHTHPTCRIGMVHRGNGVCVTPSDVLDLTPGTAFIMTAGSVHSFHTHKSSMDVVAWHPDSDTGPTDDDHPMIRRTMVGGVPAHLIPEIRTLEKADR